MRCVARAQVVQQINHEGEVNRARHMPQSPFLSATKTLSCSDACAGGAADQP